MFRKKKGPGAVGGYDRISHMMDDHSRDPEDDDTTDELDDDTIVMRGPMGSAHERDDEESVSLLDVRGRGGEPRLAPETPEEEPPAPHSSEPSYAVPPSDRDQGAQPWAEFEPQAQPPRASTAPAQTGPEPMAVPSVSPSGGSSLVAADATWEGKLRSQGDIHVEGIFRGEVDTSSTLVVAPKARVHGTVRARNVMLGGDVEGDISCEERLEILPGGSARGQINSGTLVVHEGAYIDSRFQMRQQAAPAF